MEKPSNILTLKSGKTTKQVRPADIDHNAIVNLHHVSEIITTKGRRHDVRMKSGAVMAVSYRKWANFRKRLFGK
ncbi:MAG: LytTR family transcriptional regulator DNA-binding domain-containing protein [Bacteroidales bacterium]|nr:LytTR family transcriptional regulator DNA-binding domain-containing protein [Bacteroidales bacterium]